MKKLTKTVAVPLAAVLLTAVSVSASAASSSFQNSCRNIKLHSNDTEAWISAECQRHNGQYNPTTLPLRGLVNNDGRIQSQAGAQTSYQKSCSNRRISWNSESVRIRAVCLTRNGSEREAAIELTNIENRDGALIRVNR